jgi:hypothetical protein
MLTFAIAPVFAFTDIFISSHRCKSLPSVPSFNLRLVSASLMSGSYGHESPQLLFTKECLNFLLFEGQFFLI